MERKKEIEELLECEILSPVEAGESLEKYHAIIDGRQVMLRIYNDQYYTNRFLREGIALRQVEPTDKIYTPRIIDEWPEYKIRAIEWIEFEDRKLNSDDINELISWLGSQKIQLPYRLHSDLKSHLTNIDNIHIAYQEFFVEQLKVILPQIHWGNSPKLVHGDFHSLNIGLTEDRIILYDWEYATIGSQNYDIAYLSILNPELQTIDPPPAWKALATAVITHWYLQKNQFSPKEAIDWVDRLGELTDQI